MKNLTRQSQISFDPTIDVMNEGSAEETVTLARAECVWSAPVDISLENKIWLIGLAHAGSVLPESVKNNRLIPLAS